MICAAPIANPQFRPSASGNAPAKSLPRVSSSAPLRHTLNFISKSDSLQETLTLFSIIYKLFSFTLPLAAKRARVYFQSFTNSFTFRAKERALIFKHLRTLFLPKKTPLLFLFINLQILFCKMSFFLKGLKLMATDPQLPYPRLRCQYRTQSGRQCRKHVLDPKGTLCPQHDYVRVMGFFSKRENNFRLSR
jgi:hypothetical protein